MLIYVPDPESVAMNFLGVYDSFKWLEYLKFSVQLDEAADAEVSISNIRHYVILSFYVLLLGIRLSLSL